MAELDRLVNACLMPGFGGAFLPEWTAAALDRGLAGVCLYGANLPREGAARDAVAALSGSVRAVRPDALVALDEEGGDVTRLEYRVGSRYPGNLALGVVDDLALVPGQAIATSGAARVCTQAAAEALAGTR